MPWKLNQQHWQVLHRMPIWWQQYQLQIDANLDGRTQDEAERLAFKTITERMQEHERALSTLQERAGRDQAGTAQSGTDVAARMPELQDTSEQPAD